MYLKFNIEICHVMYHLNNNFLPTHPAVEISVLLSQHFPLLPLHVKILDIEKILRWHVFMINVAFQFYF